LATAASHAELIERVEALRIPPLPHAASADWKDWYHFVLLHAASGWRCIVNVNLCGGGEQAQVQYTLVVHVPGQPAQLHGCSRSVPWRSGMVQARPLRVRTDELELAFEQQTFALRLQPRGLDLAIELQARPDGTPLLVTEGSQFGSGFIGWGLMPRLLATGTLSVCGQESAIDASWYCYQDHNFGRFRWGEDIGWEWLVAHAQPASGPALTFVVDRRTDRSHRTGGLPHLFVLVGHRLRKVFLGPALSLRWQWSADADLPPRLPGVMATLLGDRPSRRPTALRVHAADERDRASLSLVIDAYLEVVAPDHQSPAFSRIGEASGAASLALRLADQTIEDAGLAYAEYTR
jgi:hypothetical protein